MPEGRVSTPLAACLAVVIPPTCMSERPRSAFSMGTNMGSICWNQWMTKCPKNKNPNNSFRWIPGVPPADWRVTVCLVVDWELMDFTNLGEERSLAQPCRVIASR